MREGAWQAHEGLQRPGLRFLAVLSADLLLSMPGYQEDLVLVLGQVGTLVLPAATHFTLIVQLDPAIAACTQHLHTWTCVCNTATA